MSGTILDTIAEYARRRVAEAKTILSAGEARRMAEAMAKQPAAANRTGKPGSPQSALTEGYRLERALRGPGLSFICECKKASPSKGVIAENFPYLHIAEEYEAAGADAISVLTEPRWFLGSDEYLREIADAVETPCLRKDFTVDPYMIYQAKLLGASAVLLIVSLLDEGELREYLRICGALGLDALTEVHDAAEAEIALAAGARIVGVNNRNLKDFTVDPGNSRRLRELIPRDVVFVSESGVKTPEDAAAIRAMGADAVLIGETLMRATDIRATLGALRAAADAAETKVYDED